ncbi:tetratricopeptide repeat protein [Rhodoferax sp.]|uniref:tetratricopeptide repeat protein n=1 Tax=Rhodoferax sp. TaxID=50421 RepID=UPI0026322DF4|nr:tetratricopeptide repeat protein [Rhodoferax sp.]MDD4942524.1 tetratricopeptide repeat protein [Rhodoferax sp.]MDD5479518.1 tetratricopeptide repeat protein [Rhodoferax sp.]
MKKHALSLALTGLLLSSSLCFAANDESLVRPLQDQWAQIKYKQDAKQQADAYHALADLAAKLAESHPNLAEPLIWHGIAVSSEAGAKGGLGALSLAKQAKLLFEQAIQIDGTALDGSAYTSLATLYAKVPGWPLGFGDKAKADELFKKALALNPNGIDSHFLYADVLADQGKTAEAISHLEAAQKAAPRPGREVADAGRKLEIEALLKKLKP